MRFLFDQLPDGHVQASYHDEGWRGLMAGIFPSEIHDARFELPDIFLKFLMEEGYGTLAVQRSPADDCLEAWPASWFSEFSPKGTRYLVGFDRKNYIRPFYISSFGEDGIASLPEEMAQEVGVARDIVVVGRRSYFKIWDAETYWRQNRRNLLADGISNK